MKYIFIFSVVLFSSCGKWKSFCCSKCDIQTKDSVWTKTDTVVEHDTIKVPYREVNWDTTFVFAQDVVLHRVVKDKGVTGTIDINKGKLSFKCESDSLKFVIEKLKEIITENRIKVETKYLPCNEKHIKPIDNFYKWFSWIFIIISAIIGIGYWYIRAVKG